MCWKPKRPVVALSVNLLKPESFIKNNPYFSVLTVSFPRTSFFHLIWVLSALCVQKPEIDTFQNRNQQKTRTDFRTAQKFCSLGVNEKPTSCTHTELPHSNFFVCKCIRKNLKLNKSENKEEASLPI